MTFNGYILNINCFSNGVTTCWGWVGNIGDCDICHGYYPPEDICYRNCGPWKMQILCRDCTASIFKKEYNRTRSPKKRKYIKYLVSTIGQNDV